MSAWDDAPLSKRVRKRRGDGEGEVRQRLEERQRFVVLGGGVAGVSCSQELYRLNKDGEDTEILLVSTGESLKESSSVAKLTHHLEEIAVFEKTADRFAADNPGIAVESSTVEKVDLARKVLSLSNGQQIKYDKLCICTGAMPKPIAAHPHVVTLRDTESIEGLLKRLQTARHVCIVGNGGIAMELVHALTFCDISWIVRDDFIGSAFLDATASMFLMPSLHDRITRDEHSCETSIAHAAAVPTALSANPAAPDLRRAGFALGPDWAAKSDFLKRAVNGRKATTTLPVQADGQGKLHLYLAQEVVAISDSSDNIAAAATATDTPRFPLYLRTSAGSMVGCDFIVSATGVYCDGGIEVVGDDDKSDGSLTLAADDQLAISVNDRMETSCPGVYAAGDCCHYTGNSGSEGNHWHQMKLWSQARIMGRFAAQCMSLREEQHEGAAAFRLFAHLTRFFGFKVVLLGRYNAQGFPEAVAAEVKGTVFVQPKHGLDSQNQTQSNSQRIITIESDEGEPRACLVGAYHCASLSPKLSMLVYSRVCPGDHYVKAVVLDGKVIGAMLIGDTDLEEVFENLILNGTDVSAYGADLLNPNIDIQDYFD